jgi:hypothetical protein
MSWALDTEELRGSSSGSLKPRTACRRRELPEHVDGRRESPTTRCMPAAALVRGVRYMPLWVFEREREKREKGEKREKREKARAREREFVCVYTHRQSDSQTYSTHIPMAS